MDLLTAKSNIVENEMGQTLHEIHLLHKKTTLEQQNYLGLA